MAIINKLDISGASTVFQKSLSKDYLGDESTAGNYRKWAMIDNKASTHYEFDILQGYGMPRELVSDSVSRPLYAYKVTIPTKVYENTHSVARVDLLGNPEMVADGLSTFVKQLDFNRNAIAVEALTNANSIVGYDNVPVASAAHPLVAGGTRSNLYGALSYNEVSKALTGIRSMTDITGKRPLGIQSRGAVLMVSPKNEFLATEILKNFVRQQGMTSAGATDTGTVVTSAAIDNVINSFGIELVVEPLLATSADENKWFIFGKINGQNKGVVYNTVKGEALDDATLIARNPFVTFQLLETSAVGFGMWESIAFGGF